MGYRSDVRIRLTKHDFERLKQEFEEKLIKTQILDWNLFENLDVYKEQENYEWYELAEDNEWDTVRAHCVYFGWNDLKWYNGYNDVDFINDFVFNCSQYAFIRIGESSEGDIETLSVGFDNIGYSYIFDDDEGGKQ